jgi:hypothetical protein
MRRLLVTLFLAVALAPASPAPLRSKPDTAKSAVGVSPGHRRPVSRSDALQHAKAGHGGKTSVRRVVVTRMVHGRVVRVSRIVRVRTEPVVPPHPEPERLKEIQKALAEKGYFKGELNGEWNAESMAALKQFQTDRNLAADGKLNALSLIGLGLGPKHEQSATLPAPAKPDQITPQ